MFNYFAKKMRHLYEAVIYKAPKGKPFFAYIFEKNKAYVNTVLFASSSLLVFI